jgi:hypothetical protein
VRLARCQQDPHLTDFQTPTNSLRFCVRQAFWGAGIDYISFSHPLKSVDEHWDLALGSFVRVSTVIGAQTADVQQRIRVKVEQIAQQYASANGLQIPAAFRVIAGTR